MNRTRSSINQWRKRRRKKKKKKKKKSRIFANIRKIRENSRKCANIRKIIRGRDCMLNFFFRQGQRQGVCLGVYRVLVNFSYSRLFDCYRRLQDAGGLGATPPAGSRGSAPAGSEGQRPWRGQGAEPLAGSRGSAPGSYTFFTK